MSKRIYRFVRRCSTGSVTMTHRFLKQTKDDIKARGNFYQLFPDGRICLSFEEWGQSGTVDMDVLTHMINNGKLKPVFARGMECYYADEVNRLTGFLTDKAS